MKRTYADVVGEYYDQLDGILDLSKEFELRETDIKKAFRSSRKRLSRRLIED